MEQHLLIYQEAQLQVMFRGIYAVLYQTMQALMIIISRLEKLITDYLKCRELQQAEQARVILQQMFLKELI